MTASDGKYIPHSDGKYVNVLLRIQHDEIYLCNILKIANST